MARLEPKADPGLSQDGLGLEGGKATSVGGIRASVGSRVAGSVSSFCATLTDTWDPSSGSDAVGQGWAMGAGGALTWPWVEMKSQNPATNEKWEARDVM